MARWGCFAATLLARCRRQSCWQRITWALRRPGGANGCTFFEWGAPSCARKAKGCLKSRVDGATGMSNLFTQPFILFSKSGRLQQEVGSQADSQDLSHQPTRPRTHSASVVASPSRPPRPARANQIFSCKWRSGASRKPQHAAAGSSSSTHSTRARLRCVKPSTRCSPAEPALASGNHGSTTGLQPRPGIPPALPWQGPYSLTQLMRRLTSSG